MTQEEYQNALELHRDEALEALAETTGCLLDDLVERFLRDAVPFRPLLWDCALASRLMGRGLNLGDLAGAFGLKEEVILARLEVRSLVRIGKERSAEVVRLYQEGMELDALVDRTGYRLEVVLYCLCRAKVRLRAKLEWDLELAARLYGTPIGCRLIRLVFGMCQSTINQLLRTAKVAIKRARTNHVYNVNESVFDTVNDQSAYWIGMMMADGYVYRSKDGSEANLKLSLQEGDRETIERFREFLQTDTPIYWFARKSNRHQHQVLLRVNSKRLVSQLEHWGVVQCKSHIAKAHVDLVHNRRFWAGVLDGDGCIRCFYSKKKHTKSTRRSYQQRTGEYLPSATVALSIAAPELITQFGEYIMAAIGTQPKVRLYAPVIYRILLCAENAQALLRETYRDDADVMFRKRIVIDMILLIDYSRRQRIRAILQSLTTERLEELYSIHQNLHLVAQALGLCISTLRSYMKSHQLHIEGASLHNKRAILFETLTKDGLFRMLKQAGTWNRVAAQLNMSSTLLHYYMSTYDLYPEGYAPEERRDASLRFHEETYTIEYLQPLYDQARSHEGLAGLLGITVNKLRHDLKRHNIKLVATWQLPSPLLRFTTEDERQVVRNTVRILYEEHGNWGLVANHLKMKSGTLLKYLKRHQLYPDGTTKSEMYAAAADRTSQVNLQSLLDVHGNLEAVAAALGYKPDTLSTYISRRGYQLRFPEPGPGQ